MDDIHSSTIQPVDGLKFRTYQGDQDLPAMLEVFLSLNLQDHENIIESLEDITNKYQHMTHCDPYHDVLIAEINERMAGYGRVHWHQLEASGDCIYSMEWWIRPECQGKSLGKAFFVHCKQRLRQIARHHTDDQPDRLPASSPKRLFEVDIRRVQPELVSLLEEDGFKAIRWYAQMTCSDLQNVPEFPMPAGLEIRPARPEHYHQVWEGMLDGFHDDPDYSEPTEEAYTGWLHSAQFQPDLWQIGWDGDQIAGMVLNYVTHDLHSPARTKIAWTEDICVGPRWRRRGLARALLAKSMLMFRSLGFTQTSLGVDLNNLQRAPQLYESMGYQMVSRGARYQKPVDL